MKVSKEFKRIFSEKLMDLGNLGAGALVLGQYISQKEFSSTLFTIGLFIMSILYYASYLVSRERR